MKTRALHRQAALDSLALTCDARIAHIIIALNSIDGVATTNSCWNNNNKGIGYVNIVTQGGDFIGHLKRELDNAEYQVDDSMQDGSALVRIRPRYDRRIDRTARDEFLDQKWNGFLNIAIKYLQR